MKILMKKLSLLITLIMICLSIGVNVTSANELTQTIEVQDDTYIAQDTPEANYNDKNMGFCSSNSTYNKQPLLRFNMSQLNIPDGYEIDTAKVKLNLTDNYTTTTSVSVYALTSSDYDVTTITWNTKGTVAKGTKAGTATITAGDEGWVEIDISEYIKENPSAAQGVQGFMFASDAVDGKTGFIFSKESDNPPSLTVTYKVAEVVIETTQTIGLQDDTYISGRNPDTNYASNEQLGFQNHNQAAYTERPLLRFNMSQLNIPEGYEIDTAVVKLNISYNYITSAQTMSLFTLSNSTYDVSTIRWNTEPRPSVGAKLGSVSVGAKGTGWVEIDISSYIKENPSVTEGVQAVTFLTDAAVGQQAGIYSMESANAPKLTVTYAPKAPEAPKTSEKLVAIDSTGVERSTPDTAESATFTDFDIQNKGTSYDRRAYVKFDLSNIEIPEGKVITSAVLEMYVTNNYNGTADILGLYEISDDSWKIGSLTYNTSEDLVNYAGFMNVPAKHPVNEYCSADVTGWITNQYYTDANKIASIGIFPEGQSAKAVEICNHLGQNPPKLTINYGDPVELSFGNPSYYYATLENPITAFNNKGMQTVTIPVYYASTQPKKLDLFVAVYNKATNQLVSVDILSKTVYSANGEHAFAERFSVPDPTASEYYAKTFVWNSSLAPQLSNTVAINSGTVTQ